MHISAPLKSFFDMTFDYWMVHRPRKWMFSKKAVIVSTSAGSTTRSAMKDVEDSLFNMGVPYIRKYGIAVQAMNWDGVLHRWRKYTGNRMDGLGKIVHGNSNEILKQTLIFSPFFRNGL